MSVAEELSKLEELRRSAAITEEDYARAKEKVLANPPQPQPFSSAPPFGGLPADLEAETRQWGLFLHLSIFAGYIVLVAGLIAPVIIWQLKKEALPGLDAHGKNALNWILSFLIYGVVSGLLIVVGIGIPLLIALGLCGIIFPIIAAIKANNGVVWKYPMAISFFS